jgi:hypothetical protein
MCCACFCGIAAGATSLAERQRPHFPYTPVPARAVFCAAEIGQNGSNFVTGWNNMQNAQVIRPRIVQNRKLYF